MKQLILQYDYSGCDQNHPVNSFFIFRHSNKINHYPDRNRYSDQLPMLKKANSEFIPVGFFIPGIRIFTGGHLILKNRI